MTYPRHDNGGGDVLGGRDERIPDKNPLRNIRQVENDALASLDAGFEVSYTDFGRSPIRPERLIRASLLQILFSVRS